MTAEPTDLSRRAEEACLNGWPALREIVFDGWLLRFSDGHTKRVNSANPLAPGTRDLGDKIRYCERLFASHGLPTIFRLTTLSEPNLDAALDRFGYAPAEDETRVIYRGLDDRPEAAKDDAAALEERLSEEWLAAYARLSAIDERARIAHGRILGMLAVPAAFASVRGPDGGIASVGFGAIHDGIVCVNSVVTDPAARRTGLSRRVLAVLLDWARGAGATGACLPVVAANAPAVALYERLGFTTELLRYRYRRQTMLRSGSGRPAATRS